MYPVSSEIPTGSGLPQVPLNALSLSWSMPRFGHEWDGLRRKIKCARVDFDEPESHQCRSCARCVVELYVPRLQCRNSWLRWVSQNASELTRSSLQLSACEFGVTIELERSR